MSIFRGEYWITDEGNNYADGDIGDMNHEGIALERARRLLISALGYDTDAEYVCETVMREALDHWLIESLEMSQDEADEKDSDFIKKNVGCLGIEEHLVDAAYDRCDLREYAMKYWGWKWMKKGWVGTHTLTRDDFKMIAEAAMEIMDAEGNWTLQEAIDGEETVEIAVQSTGKTYWVSFADLDSVNYEALGIAEEFPRIGRNDQVRRMDVDSMPEHYKGHFGD